MKRQEAEEFNKELKIFMEEQTKRLGLEKGTGANLVDQFIEIYPDDVHMIGMIDLKDKGSFSVKPGNVLVNQKAMLLAGVDWLLSVSIPENLLNYIQLCLATGIAVYKSVKVELDENESYIVAYLHSHQMYERGDIENAFYHNFSVWYRQQTGDEISEKRIQKAMKNLLDLNSIAIEDGEVRLKEQVWRNKLSE